MNTAAALVTGQPIEALPKDLYIPPDALRVILEVFEGPLDLLLYLIRRQNLDILDIPVAKITHQYVNYINMMKELQVELAADYLEMAALLTEIKSRMLLPKPPAEEDEEQDPRAELIRRLQMYQQIKQAAEDLEKLPRSGRDFFTGTVEGSNITLEKRHPDVDLDTLIFAFKDVLKRAQLQTAHHIERESLSVRERMSRILSELQDDRFVLFTKFFDQEEGRMGLVVTFLAILEMTKERVLELVQSEPFAPVYVRIAA